MSTRTRNVVLAVLGLCVAAALYLATRGQETESAKPSAPAAAPVTPATPVEAPHAAQPAGAVPTYYPSAEAAKPFPRIVPAGRYRDYPVVANVYAIAARIPEVLAQQPCYCWCEQLGHGSLLDCFATDHGAGWDVCLKEVLLADRLTRQGKSPAQIREAIIRGHWRTVSLLAAER